MDLRVFTFTTEYPPKVIGGLSTHVSELTNGLSGLGCEITILSPAHGEPGIHHQPNVTIHRIQIPPILIEGSFAKAVILSNKHFSSYAQALIEEQKNPPAIIHCHDWMTYLAASEVGQNLGIPVIATVHLLYEPTHRWGGDEPDDEIVQIERSLCQQTRAIITVSHSMRELIKTTYGVPGEKIHVVHNGIDPSLYLESGLSHEELTRLRQSLAEPDEKIILFAGRLVTQKGVTDLLESACEVIARNEKARYVIAGSMDPGVGAERLTTTYKELYPQYSKLWGRLKFLGMLSREHLAQLYQVADMAIVPSIYEPFGYAAAEAMAAGVPVIATRTGGLAEIVVDGETGLLVPVHSSETGARKVDVEKLTEAQMFLLENSAIAKRMGEAGRQRIIKEFSREKMVKSVRDIYYDFLAKSATA